ncbi:MAG: DeoD-type purine-nucleoside phosphorylase [Bacteroidetes bacterium]|nr:MAG: DeoD-type purine-nucleoside phosphorylase [Bacteroidota bacterium]REK03548.1 MAG: DeoD-type purine-nucleoside phosphorylase [Bacteroidota bacterium]REK34851.1 MAG: DeoD-type purine-nucleoside phosphorylase [Bacteroidota bacterium]REK51222.1 MAG: DeoD-type purine-nucleoside phosphorylase [Bacteroidota bacterium]
MSVHISAKAGEIAKVVLMPGDPLRAKHIAEKYLENPKLVSTTRNAFMYTGSYNGYSISVGASGMGCPSIGIYSFELYAEYNVDCIIRIGTAGAYAKELKLYDLLNVEKAYSESTYAECAFGYKEDNFLHQGIAFSEINNTSAKLGMDMKTVNIHSSDVFYRSNPALPEIAGKNNCLAVEMESFALFANALYLKKMAGCILTISDVIGTSHSMSAEQREKSLENMFRLAMESAAGISSKL